MKYGQKEIKPLIEDKKEYGIHIKIRTDNKSTNWFIITKEQLNEIYNSFN